MTRLLLSFALAALGALAGTSTARADEKPITIGVTAPIQLQVGRDEVDAVQMAVDEINAAGGVAGRKLQIATADSTMDPQQGVAAIKKLTADDHVDVLIGGYNSGVVLAQEPHIAAAKTIYIDIGSGSPAIADFVKKDYNKYKYVFHLSPLNVDRIASQLVSFADDDVKGRLHLSKIAILGENAKWVQDLAPGLKAGLEESGMTVTETELFDPDMSDFSPLFDKVKRSGAQYMMLAVSHANSDVFVKQWYDAKLAIPIGGIDIKSQDADFFSRIGGKAISETVFNQIIPAAITLKTMAFWDAFVARYKRPPVYTAPGAYDAVHIYADAVAETKSTDADKLIPEIEKIHYLGTQGTYEFDDHHDVKAGPGLLNILMVQWQGDGKRVVVWPKALATGEIIPPPWMDNKN